MFRAHFVLAVVTNSPQELEITKRFRFCFFDVQYLIPGDRYWNQRVNPALPPNMRCDARLKTATEDMNKTKL